jgi:hypothetical protein
MINPEPESTRARSNDVEKSPVDKVMNALSIAILCALAAAVAFVIWNGTEKDRQFDTAYVQAIEDMYGGVEVEKLIGEGQVKLTHQSADAGRDHCFGPEEYRVVADSVGSPDALLCLDRDDYRQTVNFVESEGGEIIGRDMEDNTLSVVFKNDGPFGISCTLPQPNDVELHCTV